MRIADDDMSIAVLWFFLNRHSVESTDLMAILSIEFH